MVGSVLIIFRRLGKRPSEPRFLRILSLVVWLTVVWGVAVRCCAAEEAPPLDRAEVDFFEKRIRPILVEHCYECHSDDDSSGGLLVNSRSGLRAGGDSGPAIVEGNADGSLLIQAVRYENRDLQMPPQNRLSDRAVELLERWVASGAADPRQEPGSSPIPTGMSLEDRREFWSFQPAEKPKIPHVEDTGWVRSPVDAFVLSRLEQEAVELAEPADRRALIRRMTFDVTGLPPTREQIDAFAADNEPGAVGRLVDRLLASPQYGVRWGRHWLDVARYADSNGLDENLAFGNAWRYRDYVIDAFNEDRPFDRFLIEQLAGDLLSDANRQSRIATGFLVLGAKVLAEPDREKLVMDTVDEQVDTIGKAFLGMTFGCARCHDHKFDPVRQSDYYRLAAIFKSTKTFADSNTGAIRHWNQHVFATEQERAAIEQIDQQIAEKKKAASTFKNQSFAELRNEARSKATDYLVAATKVQPTMSLDEVTKIAQAYGLHTRVLHHCRRHLEFHRSDPFFRSWHESAGESHAERVREHYAPLFRAAAAAAADNDETESSTGRSAVSQEQVARARQAIDDRGGFLAVPAKPEFAFDEETLDEYNRLMEDARVLESQAPDVPAAMAVCDGDVVCELPIHIRGSHLNLGKPVKRGFPEVMVSAPETQQFPEDQSGRLQLARWMARPDHPLTARVYVNRIWRWHFGRGIVASTENFGILGDQPSHPALLDWLACELVDNGWSTKHIHRLILTSSVYRMSSTDPGNRVSEADPENLLLWKFPMRRLEAEEIRDAILAVSGHLDGQLGGKTVPLRNRQFVFNHTSVDHTKYESLRRAVYLPVIRNNLYGMFEQFDFPDPTMPTGDRATTTVAPQALWMMNSPLVMDSARSLAGRLLGQPVGDETRVESAYWLVLGRAPEAGEHERALRFIDEVRAATPANTVSKMSNETAKLRAWSLFCQTLLASNEFIHVR